MLDYELGEMKGVDGSVLWYETGAKASEYAVRISRAIESAVCYKQLTKKLTSPRLILYFQYIIKEEIYPFVCQGCVIQWNKRNGKPIPHSKGTVLIPKFGIFYELEKCWDFKDVPIKLVNPISFNALRDVSCRVLFRKLIRAYTKRHIVGIIKKLDRVNNGNLTKQITKMQTIACYYAEGLDFLKRNDLNWYPESGIDSKRILIYFDRLSYSTGRPIERETIQQIEKQGFRWVALKRNIIENQGSKYWQPPPFRGKELLKKRIAQNNIEKWIVNIGNDLLKQVYYWRSFYDEFNISINYTVEEGLAKNIIQAIAFDIDNKKPGILVGKQRSEIYLPFTFYLGYYPKQLFFIWNKRAMSYVNPSYEQIENFIVSGYPNNIFEKQENFSSILRSKGTSFVVALLDNAYGPETSLSVKGVSEFYKKMLEWVLGDKTLGIIIKSKKPNVINSLSSIHPLLNKALETGRCIRLEDEWGRLPSDASFGADFAIGICISTAVIESVIGGCRGIHYDVTHLKKHEFYKWGYEKIVFDDLERMISALKRYKEGSGKETKLGNWSSYLDELDSFLDGRGGERMGTYMRWLLEAFDKEKDRSGAIQYANEQYIKQWGEDKVINMRQRDG